MATGADLTDHTGATALQLAKEAFGTVDTIVSPNSAGAAGSEATGGYGDALPPSATPGRTGVVLSSSDPNRLIPIIGAVVGRQAAARFPAMDRKNGALFPEAARPPLRKYQAQVVLATGLAA